MHRAAASLLCAITLVSVAGCASLPKDTYETYYLTTTVVKFTVVRTVGCTEGNRMLAESSVIATPENSADLTQPKAFDLHSRHGRFVDSDVKFDRTDDGRLLGVNAVSTGQGGTVIKDVGSMLLTVAAAAAASEDKVPPPDETACKDLKSAGETKPITLTYEGTLPQDWAKAKHSTTWQLDATEGSGYYADLLQSVLGTIVVAIDDQATNPLPSIVYPIPPLECSKKDGKFDTPAAPSSTPLDAAASGQVCREDPKADHLAVIHARQPALVRLHVYAEDGTLNGKRNDVLWTGTIPTAQLGTPYDIPLSPPRPFGGNTTALTFSDSGALTSIRYAVQSGAGQILDAADATLTKAQNEKATEAADLKAQADVIAQQQRVVLCKTSPKDCKP